MSWSVNAIGKPEAICRAIDKAVESYGEGNQSRAEFDEAAPHLKALVGLAVGDGVVINLAASGHATFMQGVKVYGSVSVKIDQLYGLVE